MLELINLSKEKPYLEFQSHLKSAIQFKQKSIDAISISSFNLKTNEVESRFVNLKFIEGDEWIFFSNYNSLKSNNFLKHDQISALLYWNNTNIQIRIKAKIAKTSDDFSDTYFKSRNKEKNALAISSMQSTVINSYQEIKENFEKVLNSSNLNKRPNYWGGFAFVPYYFEFWEGHESRLNKRDSYQIDNGEWRHSFLQP